MDRKSCVVCLIILFLFCSIAQATNYSMRYNAQTGRGDWIIADSSIYSVVDEVYGAGWDGRTDEGASLNAIYDKIETVVGGGAPGGADTQVQFNDGGAFSGESTFIYNKALNSLSIDRIVIGPGVADYLMPTTRGAANTYLRDNGAGAVTFSALSGIGPANFTPNADFGDINTGAGGELRFGADSIDDSHLNWGSMTYLGEEGESLVTAYAAVGTFESGDTFICYEAGVGARECDYDDMPAGGSGDLLADGTVPMTANWAMGDFQMTMGGLVVDMDGSADQMQINQTAVAGTENQPLIFINDDRVGLTVNEDDEAALRIDSEGAYAIWVEDGKVDYSSAEDHFYEIIRKWEDDWIKEAEEEEVADIIDNLTPEEEDKLTTKHSEN